MKLRTVAIAMLAALTCGCGGRVTIAEPPPCLDPCPATQVCRRGVCQEVACATDGECTDWKARCLDALCTLEECSSDAHCSALEVCAAGRCASPCASEADCEPGERCAAGACSPPFFVEEMIHQGQPRCPAVSERAIAWTEEVPEMPDAGRVIVKPFDGPRIEVILDDTRGSLDISNTHVMVSGPHLLGIDYESGSLDALPFPWPYGGAGKMSPTALAFGGIQQDMEYYRTSADGLILLAQILPPSPGLDLWGNRAIVFDVTEGKLCFEVGNEDYEFDAFMFDVARGAMTSIPLAGSFVKPDGRLEWLHGCAPDGLFTIHWDYDLPESVPSVTSLRHYDFSGELIEVHYTGSTSPPGTDLLAPQPVGDRLIAFKTVNEDLDRTLTVWDRVLNEEHVIDTGAWMCPQSVWPYLVWLDQTDEVVRVARFVE